MITVIEYSFMLGAHERQACDIQVLDGPAEITKAIDEIREVVESIGGEFIESATVIRPLNEEDRKLLEDIEKEQAFKWLMAMVEAYKKLVVRHTFEGFIEFVKNKYNGTEDA